MPLTIGIDPTSRDTMGWATVESGCLIDFGDVPLKTAPDQTELGLLEYQADALASLLARKRPHAVVIERPIINSRAAARYLSLAAESGDGATMVGRMTGAVMRSIDVGVAVGVLVHVCMLCGLRPLILNPGAAKAFACGWGNAKKQAVREAARLRVYERAYNQAQQNQTALPLLDAIKRPSEHIAAAIFIGLAGEQIQREQAMLIAA